MCLQDDDDDAAAVVCAAPPRGDDVQLPGRRRQQDAAAAARDGADAVEGRRRQRVLHDAEDPSVPEGAFHDADAAGAHHLLLAAGPAHAVGHREAAQEHPSRRPAPLIQVHALQLM